MSLLVHGGLLLAITLAARQPPAPPVVQVDEGTPVDIVLEGADATVRTALAGLSLPLEAMPPAAIPEPASAAPVTPDTTEAAVDQPPAAAAPTPAEPAPVAPAASSPPALAAELPAPPDLAADAAPAPSARAPAAPPALVFAENEPAAPAAVAPGPALEAGAPPMAAPSFVAPTDAAELAASEPRIADSAMPALAAPDPATAVQDAGRPTAVAASEPPAAPALAPIADALPPPQEVPALVALTQSQIPPSTTPSAAPASAAVADAPIEALPVRVAEPAKSEPAKSEPAKSEPAKSEPPKSEPTKWESPSSARPVNPAPTVLTLVAPPATIVPSDPRRGVEDALQSLDCAHVSAKVDLLGGTVTLSGHARSGEDRSRLAATVGALPGIRRVDSAAVSVVGEPYCRVLAFLGRPEFQRSTEQRGDLLTLGATSGPGTRRAVGGETLSFTMSAPEFDAFLYIDHFSADGRVQHLLPTDRPDNIFKKDAVFRLGAASPLGRKAVVGPPYGLDVVVVVASSEPIFVRPRPASEEASPYLAALDGRLRTMAESGIRPRLEYAYYLVSTSAPPGR